MSREELLTRRGRGDIVTQHETRNGEIQRDLSFKTEQTSHCSYHRRPVNETEDAYLRDAHFHFLEPLERPNTGD